MHDWMTLLSYSFANNIIHTSLSQYEKEFGQFSNRVLHMKNNM